MSLSMAPHTVLRITKYVSSNHPRVELTQSSSDTKFLSVELVLGNYHPSFYPGKVVYQTRGPESQDVAESLLHRR